MSTRSTVIALVFLLQGCFAAPGYEGEKSSNFDGRLFHNRAPMNQGPLDMISLAWGTLTQSTKWPDAVANNAYPAPDAAVHDGISVTYINHATVLIQVAGLNILTDPVYSDRASPVSFAGPKRVRAPGIPLTDLPHIDVVLISHNHYDHLDEATLTELFAQQTTPPVLLAGLGNKALLEQLGLTAAVDLQWNDTHMLDDITFTFVECRHRSGRGIGDQMKTLWGSFVIETPDGNIYFAGDTGYAPHFAEQGDRYGPFALTILPIGAYEPRWFMKEVHLNPAEAVTVHQELQSSQSLGIHFGVFKLTYEGINDPERDLAEALSNQGVSAEDFWVLEPGESRIIKK